MSLLSQIWIFSFFWFLSWSFFGVFVLLVWLYLWHIFRSLWDPWNISKPCLETQLLISWIQAPKLCFPSLVIFLNIFELKVLGCSWWARCIASMDVPCILWHLHSSYSCRNEILHSWMETLQWFIFRATVWYVRTLTNFGIKVYIQRKYFYLDL